MITHQNQEELASTSKQDSIQKQEGLTAKQIFDKIIKGQTVRIPNDPILANQLKNHLNVIKSREKKLFASLGLDFVSSVISVKLVIDSKELSDLFREAENISAGQIFRTKKPTESYYQISLIAPKTRRKYPAFSIEQEPDANPI